MAAEEALFGTNDSSTVKKWSALLGHASETKKRWSGYEGSSEGSVAIVRPFDGSGDTLTYQQIYPLLGQGVVEAELIGDKGEDPTIRNDSLKLGMTRNMVRLGDKMSAQRTAFDLRSRGRTLQSNWAARVDDIARFNHVCGFTPANTLYNASFRGHNTVVAPSSYRRIYAPKSDGTTHATDEAVGADSTALLTTTVMNWARERVEIEDLDNAVPTIPMMDTGEFVLFVHPSQLTDIRENQFWQEIQVGRLMPNDNANPLYKWAVGKFGDILVVPSQYVTQGVHSTTGAAVANTRRAVLCGAGALSVGYGKDYGGGSWSWTEEVKDGGMFPQLFVDRIWGCKKNMFGGVDAAVITITTYSTAH